jgi:predicted DNA-binding antitoxin AbrB/MazE fold protein
MKMTVKATYEGGVLKPAQPLPFAEHAQLRVTLEPTELSSERPSWPCKAGSAKDKILLDRPRL